MGQVQYFTLNCSGLVLESVYILSEKVSLVSVKFTVFNFFYRALPYIRVMNRVRSCSLSQGVKQSGLMRGNCCLVAEKLAEWVFIPIVAPFGDHKLENEQHKNEHTVFSLTVGCSPTQCTPQGKPVIVSAGQQGAALNFTAAHPTLLHQMGRVTLAVLSSSLVVHVYRSLIIMQHVFNFSQAVHIMLHQLNQPQTLVYFPSLSIY